MSPPPPWGRLLASWADHFPSLNGKIKLELSPNPLASSIHCRLLKLGATALTLWKCPSSNCLDRLRDVLALIKSYKMVNAVLDGRCLTWQLPSKVLGVVPLAIHSIGIFPMNGCTRHHLPNNCNNRIRVLLGEEVRLI